MTASYLVAARRTAVAPCNGQFAHLLLHELAVPVIDQVIQDAGIDKAQVNELIVANCLGEGGNPARVIALASDLPQLVAGLSIDRQCAGGLDALLIADAMIRSGVHDVVIAGGVESYSRQPIRMRTFADGSEPVPYTQARFTPWPDQDPDMAQAADAVAQTYHISKQEQDEWAIESHRKALDGLNKTISEPIIELDGVVRDTFTRRMTKKICDRAPVVFGSITSANMAVAADSAAFVAVVSEKIASTLDCAKVQIVSGSTCGADAQTPAKAPVKAIKIVLEKANLSVSDLTHAEIMEAFAVQTITCLRQTGLPVEITNPLGGALARGHPIGASGAILCVNLFHNLCQTQSVGLAAIAAAGGLGSAVVLKSM